MSRRKALKRRRQRTRRRGPGAPRRYRARSPRPRCGSPTPCTPAPACRTPRQRISADEPERSPVRTSGGRASGRAGRCPRSACRRSSRRSRPGSCRARVHAGGARAGPKATAACERPPTAERWSSRLRGSEARAAQPARRRLLGTWRSPASSCRSGWIALTCALVRPTINERAKKAETGVTDEDGQKGKNLPDEKSA